MAAPCQPPVYNTVYKRAKSLWFYLPLISPRVRPARKIPAAMCTPARLQQLPTVTYRPLPGSERCLCFVPGWLLHSHMIAHPVANRVVNWDTIGNVSFQLIKYIPGYRPPILPFRIARCSLAVPPVPNGPRRAGRASHSPSLHLRGLELCRHQRD